MATVQEEGGPQEERGENLTSGATDFDHKNLGRMERHLLISLNLEHDIYGKTNSKDIPKKKARVGTLAAMALVAMGDPTAEAVLEVQSAEYVADSMIDRGENGFERKAGISTQSFNYTIDGSRGGGGFWHRVRHPSGGGQPQAQGVQ